MSTTSRQTALRFATEQLQHLDTPRLDAEILLTHVLGISRAQLYAWPEKLLDDTQWQQFQSLIEQRVQHQPIAYLTGHKEFWSLNLQVNAATLIPRPETELLVEHALKYIESIAQPIILDLGTGSGAIALALAQECPQAQVIAVDVNPQALEMAKHNAQALQLNQVQFYLSHWFRDLPMLQAHIIVSNPPYIADDDPHLTQGDVQFEPRQALTSGQDGLNDIREIAAQAKDFLLPEGYLLFEHGYDQEVVVQQILLEQGYQKVETIKDLAGQARVSLCQNKT
ncbi:peptide chain release factor N(5)-glutamine methyltransferase [Candidatus Albibeggiatoa sp. nov. NOAA]|uniref:peptide chain release factor N(5)-glutamine methyltransferase n=1 Tax=Candidatus Albibeggiatoa sp. nov. NOAA TaxID=3162724 RepID=UPI00330281C8|nr:peptide chain release factor N(5)-glutamine methyltransferase [Thiotrichaceae bacterium]